MSTMSAKAPAEALNFLQRLKIVRDAAQASDVDRSGNEVELPEALRRADVLQIVKNELGLNDASIGAMYERSWVIASQDKDDQSSGVNREARIPSIEAYRPATHESLLVINLIRGFVRPELVRGLGDLTRSANTIVDLGVIQAAFMEAVVDELAPLCSDAAVFELGLAAREKLLTSATVDDLLDEAKNVQADPTYLAYFATKYPVLVARLKERALLVTASLQRLFARIEEDQTAIAALLGIELSDLAVARVQRGSGDSHHGADCVSIVVFNDEKKLIYKPRCVTPEAAFQRFLRWFNEHAPALNQHTCRIIARSGYGWMEFIQAVGAASQPEVDIYYRRYGALMGILNVLNTTDVHHENLIAHGAYPVVVDLETIIQPIYLRSSSTDLHYMLDLEFFTPGPLYTAMVDPAFLDSILNGSPLALTVERELRRKEIDWDPTGQLKINVGGYEPTTSHCLKFQGVPVDPYEHSDAILQGYEEASKILLRERQALYSRVIPEIFGDINIRVIFKATAKYCKIINAVNSAFAQENFLQQDDYLTKLWIPALTKPALSAIVLSEKRDILTGDVPYFSAKVDAMDVIDSTGNSVGNILAESGMVTTLRKVVSMSLPRIRRDLQTLRYCLERKRERPLPVPALPSSDEIAYGGDPRRIMHLLAERILLRDGEVTFVDLIMARDLSTRHAPLGSDMYTGLPGVVFAMAYAGRALEDKALTAKAQHLAEAHFQSLDLEATTQVGACIGLGGSIYLASHLAALWSNEFYAASGKALARHLTKVAYNDRHFDVFSGTAGALLGLKSLYQISKAPEVHDAMATMCIHLMNHADRRGGRCTWMSSIPSSGPTTGFAHGVTGIAYALIEAHEVLGDQELLTVACEVEAFVHDCFVADRNTWLEAQSSGPEGHMEVWCHGAAGIALFYRALADATGDPQHAARYRTALALNLATVSFDNDSLCHGTLGNLDAALNEIGSPSCSKALAEARAAVDSVAVGQVDRYFRCGNKHSHHSVSLFNGFAGIAYQRLRMQDPTLPSVLRFDPPDRL